MSKSKKNKLPIAQPIKNRVGILVANLGTPDATDYWSVRRYLSEFLSDRRVVDVPPLFWQPFLQFVILSTRPFASGKNYQSIWNEERNESPLLTITRDQTDALREKLEASYGDQVMVDFAMRYGNPSMKSKINEMIEAGCDKILFFPLYPHYAGPTSATANDQLFKVLAAEKHYQPVPRIVEPYYRDPRYLKALARSVETAYAELDFEPDVLVCSYHGLPKKYADQGDPYYAQCLESTELLRKRLGWDEERILTTFQSRFGPQEWLRPYTVDAVAEVAEAGKKCIAVIAPAFSADCIETLEEINEEIKESFEEAGGEKFAYIPCLNAQPAHIEALFGIIRDNLGGWID